MKLKLKRSTWAAYFEALSRKDNSEMVLDVKESDLPFVIDVMGNAPYKVIVGPLNEIYQENLKQKEMKKDKKVAAKPKVQKQVGGKPGGTPPKK